MGWFMDVLKYPILGNRVESYLLAALVALAGVIILRLLKKILLPRLREWVARTPSQTDNFILALSERYLLPLFNLGILYFSLSQLTLNAVCTKYLSAFCIIVLTIQLTRLFITVLVYLFETLWVRTGGSQETPVSASILTIVKVVVWGLGIVFIFDNLGFNVSAIVAGLGIGGVAVALAAQTILGDLFNYFVIFFDRPFEQGDFIIVDDYMGIIEKIGIKSTRIRSLDGEQIVISNSNLTASRIRNYKRMQQRRAIFEIGVTYETPAEKLRKIPSIIRTIVEQIREARLDRAHFKKFGPYSLDFEIVYFILTSDYNKYMDIQQQINLGIMEAFEKEGIEFAYPTQVEYVKAQVHSDSAQSVHEILEARQKMPPQPEK